MIEGHEKPWRPPLREHVKHPGEDKLAGVNRRDLDIAILEGERLFRKSLMVTGDVEMDEEYSEEYVDGYVNDESSGINTNGWSTIRKGL